LQEIKKRIGLGGGYQFGSFPTRQLTRRNPQYAKQVRSTVSVHGKGISALLSEACARLASTKCSSQESWEITCSACGAKTREKTCDVENEGEHRCRDRSGGSARIAEVAQNGKPQ